MTNSSTRLIEQRLLRRGVMNLLAEPLTGEAREEFLSSEEARLNSSLPRPTRAQMRSVLKKVD